MFIADPTSRQNTLVNTFYDRLRTLSAGATNVLNSRIPGSAFFTMVQAFARMISDAWDDAIHRWLNTPHEIDGLPNNVSSFDILRKALQLDPGKITKEMSTRVGISMRKLGWLKVERRLQTPRFVYERPKKSAHDTTGTSLGNGEAAAGVPF